MQKQDKALDQLNFEQQIQNILDFLFQYESSQLKIQQYPMVVAQFEALDLAACYVLFSRVEQKLPQRARLLFSGENYQGKRETLLEVFTHIIQR